MPEWVVRTYRKDGNRHYDYHFGDDAIGAEIFAAKPENTRRGSELRFNGEVWMLGGHSSAHGNIGDYGICSTFRR